METDTKSNQIVNRVAIVTGGGRGLGRAMVLGLAEAGFRVIATAAREQAEVEAVARKAGGAHGKSRVVPLVADITQESDCKRVVDAAIDRFGRLDILINNAARGMKFVSDDFITKPKRIWEVDSDTWRMIVDTNVNGPFLMVKHAVPQMLEAGWGRIINIAVNRETMRRSGFAPYGPSKAALESETIILAHDLEGTGVTVNAMLPGSITQTGMVPKSVPDNMKPLMLQPSVMVPPLLWLVSAEADGWTGHRLVANKWQSDLGGKAAAVAATEELGW